MPKLALRLQDIDPILQRRSLALRRADEVCRFLCSLGAREVFLFGSILTQDFREYSDIDFAVAGLPLEYAYRVEAQIEVILAGMPFDLVYLETAPPYLAARIKEKGRGYACHIS
jgi:predicted nucleotidyltransferase